MARGRPLGSRNKRRLPPGNSEPAPLQIVQRYHCIHCGAEKPERDFYLNKWSRMWVTTSKRIPICKNCLSNFHKRWVEEYGPEIAAEIVCHYLDLGFDWKQFNGASDADDFNIGEYVKSQNLTQRQFSTYADTIAMSKQSKPERDEDDQDSVLSSPIRWSKEDRKNKQYVVSTIGYDPYAAVKLSDLDLIFCYNVLAGYCDADGIQSDGHKIQCVIQMTNNHLQCKKIDDLVFVECKKSSPDQSKIADLSKVKKELLSSIAQIAKDNNIASAYNKNSKVGKNTLSQKMKEMAEDDYWAIKQNFFDVKTSAAMKQIADLSNQSIIEQLALDENDYAQMVREQREMITSQRDRLEELEEENRNLKNRLADLMDKPKKAGG